MPQKKYLAITADDYGPHPFINRGIIKAAEEGLITSVGVLANTYRERPSYDVKTEIEKLIAAIGTKPIGIGVHLTMSSGQAMTRERDLLFLNKHFEFQDMDEFKFSRKPDHLAAVRAEVRAQIRKVKNILEPKGIRIDHISSHNSLHFLFRDYFDETIAAINEEGIQTTVRSPLTISKDEKYKDVFCHSHMTLEGTVHAVRMLDDNFRLIRNMLGGVKAEVLIESRKKIYKHGHHCGDYLYDNFYGHAESKQLEKILKHFPTEGDLLCGELMVHLGEGDEDIWTKMHGIRRSYFKERRNELNVLRNFKFSEKVTAHKIELRSMRNLRDWD